MQQLSINNRRRALLQQPQVKSLLLGLLRHIEEPLSEREVKDLRHDRDFQLSKNTANDIEGWLADVEGAPLYALAKKCKKKRGDRRNRLVERQINDFYSKRI